MVHVRLIAGWRNSYKKNIHHAWNITACDVGSYSVEKKKIDSNGIRRITLLDQTGVVVFSQTDKNNKQEARGIHPDSCLSFHPAREKPAWLLKKKLSFHEGSGGGG